MTDHQNNEIAGVNNHPANNEIAGANHHTANATGTPAQGSHALARPVGLPIPVRRFKNAGSADPKAFRRLPDQPLTSPEVAQKRREQRKIPATTNVYRPKILAGGQPPIEGAPSIAELARALQNNVDLIYQFVHDNIDFYPNYGLHKGGYGALVDGNGNPFDQSDLMVQLLTQAGYTASYVTGTISLSATQWSNWLNISTSDIALAALLLSNGGFAVSTDTTTNVLTLDYCWVQVVIDGTSYQFDPTLKTYTTPVTGIDLATTMGYTQSTFLANAQSGATITSNYVQDINYTNVNADLASYATALANWIQSQDTAPNFNQILGGRTIEPVVGPVRNTTLPYQNAGAVVSSTLADSFKASLLVQYDLESGTTYYIDQLFYSADIYGQRLTLWYDTSTNKYQLLLNGAVQATSGAQTVGDASSITFTVTHPYATEFANQVAVSDTEEGVNYVLGNGWGYATRQLAEIHRQALLTNISGTGSAEDVLGESMSIVWFNFIGQYCAGADIINRLSGTYSPFHHQIGVIGLIEPGGSDPDFLLVNFFVNLYSTSGLTATANITAASEHMCLVWHQLEASVVTQTAGVACASTPSVIAAANAAGTPIYSATVNNWFTVVESALSGAGYTSAVLDEIQETYIAVEQATIGGTVASGGGDVLNIFVSNSTLATNPTKVSYTTVSGDTTATIATALAAAINANTALTAIGVAAETDGPIIQMTSSSAYPTTYTATVTTGSETIALSGYTVTIPANANVSVGGYFTGYGFYALSPYGENFFGPLDGSIKGSLSAGCTIDQVNTNCSINSADVDGNGQTLRATVTSPEPIDLFKGRYLYSNTDISVGNQADPYQLSFVRSYNSGNALNNSGLGLGWNHNYQISVLPSSDGFIAFGYESVAAAAAVIAQMYVCQDILNSTAPTVPVADVVTLCVANLWMMNAIANNTAVVQFGNEYQTFALLPNGSYVAPLGVKSSTTLTYSGGTFTYTTPDKVVYAFNTIGQISSSTYPFGMAIDFTYTSGQLTKVSNGYRTLNLTYSGANLSTVTDGNGRAVEYTINTSDQLTAFEDALSNSTTYSYTSGTSGLISQIFMPANPASAIVTNTYDTLNRVETQTDAYGNTWNYFVAGSRSEEIDPLGNSRVWYFDGFGSALQYTDQLGNTTVSEYDGLERPVLVTLPEGNSRALSYDQYGNLLSVVLQPKPGSGLTYSITNSFTYDPAWNKVETATDGNGHVTTFTYAPSTGPAASRLTKVVYPTVAAGTPTATFTYNSIGQMLTALDPSGVQTSLTYDPTSANLLTVALGSQAGGLNLTSTFTYDAVGNVATAEDPNLNTTTLLFDANRRLTQVTAPAPFNYVTKYSYDFNNNLTETQAQTATSALQTYAATYTIDNLVSTVTEPPINTFDRQPGPTVYQYDQLRRLEQSVDPLGNAYQYEYDPRSMISQITYPNGVISDSRTYSNNGYLKTITSALSQTTQYLLDGFDRLSTTTYDDATTEQYSYTYDGTVDYNSNLLEFTTRGGGTIVYTYDALNRTITKSPSGQAEVSYSYDLAGRLTAASVPAVSGDPSTGSFQMSYDTAGRFYQETSGPSGMILTVTLTLDNNGNITKITYPDGTIVSRPYDQLNRVTGISDTLGSVAFTYDPLSRCTLQTAGNGIASSFGYDLGNNLLSLAFNTPTTTDFSYVYNFVHQEIGRYTSDSSLLWEPSANSTTSYGAVDGVNEYPTVDASSYSYNGNGCLTGDGTYTYTYDTENQLLSVTGTGVSVSFKYDPLGRQVVKTSGSTSTRFVSAGLQHIADYNLSGTSLNRYVFGESIDEPLWVEAVSAGSITYLHADETGSIIMTSNSAGAITNQTTYDPFGNGTNVSSVNFGFSGQRFDPEVGLYYFNARYYSPALGRFLQNDPLGYSGGDLNLYSYVNNDPLNSFDPLGLVQLGGTAGTVLNHPSFAKALARNTNAFLDTYKDPWFWASTALAAIPLGRLAAGSGRLAAMIPGALSGSLAEGMAAALVKFERNVIVNNIRFGLKTDYGWRYVDIITNAITIEVKSGVQDYTPAIAKQIMKDRWLMAQGRKIEWQFWKNPLTGQGGPTQNLLYQLKLAGIPFREI